MRKNRMFLMSCAILTAAGMVIAGIGAAMGGWIYGVFIDGKGIHVNAPLLRQNNKETQKYKAEKEIQEAFNSIEIDMQYADIRVEQSDSDRYTLSYGLSGGSFQKEIKDGKLLLKHGDDGYFEKKEAYFQWLALGRSEIESRHIEKENYVTIGLPVGAKLKNILLHTDFADVVCERIQADSLNINAEYGDVSVSQVKAQHMEIHPESGRLKMEQVQGANCTIRDGYGDVMIKGMTLSDDLNIHLESGALEFRDTSVHNLNLHSEYGDIHGHQAEFATAEVYQESGECKLYDVLTNTCAIKSEYGNVELRLKDDTGDYAYDLHTEYGDITINDHKMGESYGTIQENPDRRIEIFCESGNINIQ